MQYTLVKTVVFALVSIVSLTTNLHAGGVDPSRSTVMCDACNAT